MCASYTTVTLSSLDKRSSTISFQAVPVQPRQISHSGSKHNYTRPDKYTEGGIIFLCHLESQEDRKKAALLHSYSAGVL